MSSRLGPEATEALRVIHFAILRSAMEAYGGVEVKNLGDGLMVVFPSLGAALDGSIAMQQAIDRHNGTGQERLGIRVGVATGDATEEAGDYFGEPVVEAARLCAKCDAGQIIISDLTAMLARRTDHTFTSVGELELRGIPDPVASFSVDWQPTAATGAVPIPDRLQPDMDLALAGRVAEQAGLWQAFEDCTTGARRASFLVGEPGIGKTRLGSELAVKAHGQGALTLYGRCDEELSLPYQPWVEAIGYLFENGREDVLSRAIESHGPELVMLLPQLRRRYPDIAPAMASDPETERYLLLQAVTAVLALATESEPVLLVLDDLHWADKPTLTMLRHVFTNLSASGIMIVGTYRDSDLETGHPLIDTVAALRRELGVETIDVPGLDDNEMIALLEISAGHDLDMDARNLAVLLRQETAGNPFFAHEILRNLVEVGDLTLDDDGRWLVAKTFDALALPQSVRDVVGQRIARLGEPSLKALRAAAVIGKEFELELLAEITGTDEDDLLDLLEDAVAAGILAEVPDGDERYRFLHTVARNTLESELSSGRKRRMHRKIAEALEVSIGANPGIRVGELATHWMAAAAPAEGLKAIGYAQAAGKAAVDSLAPDEAIRWFTTAVNHLELLPEAQPALRAQLLVDLGTAQQHAGDAGYRQTLLDAGHIARELDDPALMVAAALANNRGLYSRLAQIDDERIAALETALEAIGEARTAERSRLMATLFSEFEYSASLAERNQLIEEAIAIARELDDPAVLSAALSRSCITSSAPQNLERRLENSAESLQLASKIGDPSLKFWALCGVFQANVAAGNCEIATSVSEELTKTANEIGRPSFIWVSGNLAVALLSAQSQPDKVEARATVNVGIGTDAGEPDAFDYFAVAIMTVRYMQGREMEVVDQLLEVAQDKHLVPAYSSVAAMFLCDSGHFERAEPLIAAARDRGFESLINNTWSTEVCAMLRVGALSGATDAVEVLYPVLLPWAGQMACHQAFVFQVIDTILGEGATALGRFEEAAEHFDAAERVLTEFDSAFFDSTNYLGRAVMHQAQGNDELATASAQRAVERSAEGDCAGISRRAQVIIDAAR